MVNQQVLKHHWEEVRDQLQEKWDKLESSDLPSFPGNVEQLIGRIQQKTGESREAIETYLSELTEEGTAAAKQMRKRLETGAKRMAETAQQGAQAVREGYAEAGETIRRRPGQSMAAAFGLGLVAGVGIALLLRSSRPAPSAAVFDRGRGYTERFGKQIRDLRDSLAQYASMR
jgi:ElaB/YqjD/DUF883 family membrane-anchored ribosome-binding protein